MDIRLEELKKSELFCDFPEEIITGCILPHRQIQEYRNLCRYCRQVPERDFLREKAFSRMAETEIHVRI